MGASPPEGGPPLHLEVLEPSQREVLPIAGRLALQAGFYLAGGTGLALRLGHRRSVDFDWFRAEPFDPLELAGRLRAAFPDVEIRQLSEGTLHASAGGVALSFLRYAYSQLLPPIRVSEPAFLVAGLDDIAAMKLAALLQRGEKKDFVDVSALLSRHADLSGLFDAFRRKFGFDGTASLLRAVCYFDDAERSPDPLVLWPELLWPAVKHALRAAVREFASEA